MQYYINKRSSYYKLSNPDNKKKFYSKILSFFWKIWYNYVVLGFDSNIIEKEGRTMENLENDYLYYSCILIDALLEDPEGLGGLATELKNLKESIQRMNLI